MALVVITPDDVTKEARDGMNRYKTLLSLDGGGMRGLITAQVLIALEECLKETIYREKLIANEEKLKQITGPDSFHIHLGDWFDQLAGTSTGGLLALYLAARGGKKQFGDSPVGSAAGAAGLYTQEGKTIFGTPGWKKTMNQLASGAKFAHPADGLEKVLKEVFGDTKMGDLQSSTVITTVDAHNARTAIFFNKVPDKTATWHDPVPAGKVSGVQKTGSYVPNPSQGLSGFATPLRRSVQSEMALVRTESRPRSKDQEVKRTVDDLAVGEMHLMPQDQARSGNASLGWWMPPMQFSAPLDFLVWQVARTTSAAPGFLPPMEVAPLDGKKEGWPLTFIDGGLANNDPSWMGLMMMLFSDVRRAQDASIANTAILSVGTGTSCSCDVFKAGGSSKVPLMNIIGFLGPLVGLTMNLNGEDKENILTLLYYGLLRVPDSQYLRIQLQFMGAKKAAPRNPAEAERLASIDSAEQPGLAMTTSGAVQGTDMQLSNQQLKALEKMDDPSPETLGAYEEIGMMLGEHYRAKLRRFVRCFLFALEDPYKYANETAHII